MSSSGTWGWRLEEEDHNEINGCIAINLFISFLYYSKKYEAAKDLIKSVKQEKQNLGMELNEVIIINITNY